MLFFISQDSGQGNKENNLKVYYSHCNILGMCIFTACKTAAVPKTRYEGRKFSRFISANKLVTGERETSAALGPFPKTWESELIVYTEESILFHDSLAINS